jgi:vanillate O-demethylase monooxygenase subunit
MTAEAMVRRAWYAIGWDADFGDAPERRWLLGDPLVVFRGGDGRLSVFDDRCPHRRYPLSRGRLVDGHLVCGYHGFTFETGGRCVAVPGQDGIPPGADARPRTVVVRNGWVWVWGDDPHPPDRSLLPDHRWTELPGWTVVGGTERIDARSSLLIDNFLDLTHETFIHPTLGNEAVATSPLEVEARDRTVVASRWMRNCPAPPLYEEACGLRSPIDRSQEIEFTVPSLFLLTVQLAPAGGGGEVLRQKIMYAITPETGSRSLEVWAVARDFNLDDERVSRVLRDGVTSVIAEDRRALEAQELLWRDGRSINVRADAAAVHARRIARRLGAASVLAPGVR